MRKAVLLLTFLASGAFAAEQHRHDPPADAQAAPMQGHSPLGNSGYLGGKALPDSLDLVPPPPEPGSLAEARDLSAASAAVAMRGTPRWELAISDAELASGRAAAAFSCTAGFPIDKDHAPALSRLLDRAIFDLGMSTVDVKNHYMRARPFMQNGQPICTPSSEAPIRRDGSYPSGHTAIGYGYGLILAEVMPERAAHLVARGRAFGDSRRICNVHWRSDIEEGAIVASATVMRLNADPAFLADLAAARAEVARLRAGSAIAMPDCAREAKALAR